MFHLNEQLSLISLRFGPTCTVLPALEIVDANNAPALWLTVNCWLSMRLIISSKVSKGSRKYTRRYQYGPSRFTGGTMVAAGIPGGGTGYGPSPSQEMCGIRTRFGAFANAST